MSARSSENEAGSTVGGAGGSEEGASGAAGSGGDAGDGGANPYGPPDADCPLLETPRLAPQVGPWLEGPDPGPRTSTDTEGTTTSHGGNATQFDYSCWSD